MVTWGTSPEDCSPVDGSVPDPSRSPTATAAGTSSARSTTCSSSRRRRWRRSRSTGSSSAPAPTAASRTCARRQRCSKGRRVSVPGMVSPGSSAVKRQAEAEGLDRIFIDAGLEWRDSGCSMCNGSNGELVAPGERCASTTNRNFEGRQGRGALTHIMSPAMVAAAAVSRPARRRAPCSSRHESRRCNRSPS